MTGAPAGEPDKVVPLPGAQNPAPDPDPPSPPGRLHGLFIAGMAGSAFVGIVALFGFITVGWPENISRLIMGLFFIAGIVFLACASAAVFAAARDTYPRRGAEPLD